MADHLQNYIDHTILRPGASQAEVQAVLREAKEYGFKAVCLESRWLELAVEELKGTSVLPITVVGFPSGVVPTEHKCREAKDAVRLGAREIDMVLNRDWLRAKDYAAVLHDLEAVVEASRPALVKVILETSELTDAEKRIACALAQAAGAAFVKTSTGFSKGGATVADVRLMRETVGDHLGVKASGGIRTREDAVKMIEAGATRLGTSASVAIVAGSPAGESRY